MIANNRNILFATRADYLTRKGGDTIQLLKTKYYLENNLGYRVEIVTDAKSLHDYPDIRIVHIFNLQTATQTLQYVVEAKRQGKKVVLSTIYWDLLHSYIVEKLFSKFGNIHFAKGLSLIFSLFKPLLNIMPGERYLRKDYISIRKSIIDNCDLLLPNSFEEMEIIENEFGYKNLCEKSYVVPNAVALNDSLPESNIQKNGIVIIGRIEPNKNQLNFIKAIKKSKLKDERIYIIGRVGDLEYYNKLREEASDLQHVTFIEELPYEQVVEYYKKCKVHVLPSFRESPGLVSLEALYYGCNIVVAGKPYCPINFYCFSTFGFICDPYSTTSIARAIERAYKNNLSVPEEYFEKFSFLNVAIETHNAYEKLFSS